MPRCLIIAGPNGAGKTTFAREYLPREGAMLNFVNADLLAAGLSPFNPAAARVAAGRLFLREIDRLAATGADFAFESTLSGSAYLTRLRSMCAAGYDLEIVYLRLADVRLSLQRVATRVRSGGHDIPTADIIRRFPRSWENFQRHYRPLSKRSWVFDVSGAIPILDSSYP
jgi:predicted ABC-type ATPase